MVVRGVVAARRRPCLTPGRQPQVTRAARLLRPTQATAAHEAPVALVSARARRLSAPAAVRAPEPVSSDRRCDAALLPVPDRCRLSREPDDDPISPPGSQRLESTPRGP